MSIISERLSTSVTPTSDDDDGRGRHRCRTGRGPRGLPPGPGPHPVRRRGRRPRHDARRRRRRRPPARGPPRLPPQRPGHPGGSSDHRRHPRDHGPLAAGHLRPRRLPRRRLRGRDRRVQARHQLHARHRRPGRHRAATSPSTSSPAASTLFSFLSGVPLLVLGRVQPPHADQERPPPRRAAAARRARRAPVARRRDRRRPAPRVLARLPGRRRAHPAHRLPRGDRLRHPGAGATPTTSPGRPTPSRPTPSSSWAGAFASSAQMRQAVWDLEEHDVQVVVAPKRHRRLQRAGADPPGRRPAARAPRPAARHGTPAAGASAPSTWSARRPASWPSPRPRLRRLPHLGLRPRPDRSSARPGSGGTAPSSPASSSARWSSTPRPMLAGPPGGDRAHGGPALQDGGRPAHHRARAAGCGASRSTSCRSSSTCCVGDMSLIGPRPPGAGRGRDVRRP